MTEWRMVPVEPDDMGVLAAAAIAHRNSVTGFCAVCDVSWPCETAQQFLVRKPEAPREGYIDIVFDGPPSHESGRFVEVENDRGASIRFGEWVERPDGFWALRIAAAPPPPDDELVRLEREIAEETFHQYVNTWSRDGFDEWFALPGPQSGFDPYGMGRYGLLRGLLERHPTDANLVRVKDGERK